MPGKFSKSDERWRRLNEKAIRAAGSEDWFLAGTIYYEMAGQLKEEGKDNSKLRRLGYEMKLRSLLRKLEGYEASNVVRKVEILASEDSCEYCRKLNGQTFSIEEAVKNSPIPVENCNQERGYGCRCTFLPVVEHFNR